jgi:Skp family chaperone for outer membrane proteins
VIPDAERGLDAYRKKLDDAYAAKLRDVQESIDEIQRTAAQKTAMLAAMHDENAALKLEIRRLQDMSTLVQEKGSSLSRELEQARAYHRLEEEGKEVRESPI